MRKKELGQLVASAVVAVVGAAVGVVMMSVSGKKINERKAKEKKSGRHGS